jgi:hypothetical protein
VGGGAWRSTHILKRGCCLCFSGIQREDLAHQAGRGGEVVFKGGPVVTGACSGIWELLVIRLSTAIAQRQPRPAAAIHGQMGVHAVLDAKICASFFLVERIFCSGKVTLKPLAQPSGFVPGWDWGGATAPLRAAGGSKLDCLVAIFPRVLFVIVRGHVVISYLFFWASL